MCAPAAGQAPGCEEHQNRVTVGKGRPNTSSHTGERAVFSPQRRLQPLSRGNCLGEPTGLRSGFNIHVISSHGKSTLSKAGDHLILQPTKEKDGTSHARLRVRGSAYTASLSPTASLRGSHSDLSSGGYVTFPAYMARKDTVRT